MSVRIRLIAGGLLGVLVAAAHLHAHASVPQFYDWIQNRAYHEIAAWRDGVAVDAGPYGSACGIFYFTHHPLLPSYVAVGAERLGIQGARAIAGGVALAAGLLVALLAVCRSLAAAMVVALAMLASLAYAPGYAGWLQHPIGHSWAVAAVYLIACAGLARRPVAWMALACFVAGWISIDATFVFAGMVAGILVASHGFSRLTLQAGAAAIGGFCAANLLHLGQVWCHFRWDCAALVSDYLVGVPDKPCQTSLFYRIGDQSLAARLGIAEYWLPAYWAEALANQRGAWTTPGWWACLLGCVAAAPRTGRGLAGAAFCVAGAASTAVFAPGLMPPHLHYLTRYVVVTSLGALICLAAGEAPPMGACVKGDALNAAEPPTDGAGRGGRE